MSLETIISRLEKLKALFSNNPDAEEVKSARRKYTELLEQHGLTEADLDDRKLSLNGISIREDKYNFLLVTQLLKSMDIEPNPAEPTNDKDYPLKITFMCTKVQFKEFLARLDFYNSEFQNQQYALFKAFCLKNGLFNKNKPKQEVKEEDRESPETINNILKMMDSIDESVFLKTLKKG